MKNIQVPVLDVAELDFKKGIFGNTLSIRLSRIGDTTRIPNQEAGEIRVSIEKKNIDEALSFVSAVKLEVVDQKIKSFEGS